LDELAGAVIDSYQEMASKHGVALHGRLTEALVSGDPLLLERLLANLVGNAISYNEPGGWAEIEVTSQPAAVLTVSNTGQCVPAEQVPALFEPFRRPDRPRWRRRPGFVHRPLDHRRAQRHGPGPPPARTWPDRGDRPPAGVLRLNATAGPARVAARTGNSARVLHDVYTHCIGGHDDTANEQIEHALRSHDQPPQAKASGSPNTGTRRLLSAICP
jgi:hypothetical protein